MKKICVMHQASIGDTLLATPVYRAAKECYPECELVAVTSHTGYELLYGNPYIDSLIPYEKGDSAWRVLKAIWRADAAIILDFHYRNALYAFLAMIPKRIGLGKDFVNIHVTDLPLRIYEPYKYLNVAAHAGVSTDCIDLTRPMATDSEIKHVRQICAEIRADEKQKLILLAPYSLKNIKNWAPSNYAALSARLKKAGHITAVLGGPERREQAANDFPQEINLAGRTNLRETAALIAEADLLVCGCTSVLHICATTATPSLAIYGPTLPAQWAPKHNCTVLTHNLPCSPCHSADQNPCQKDNICIKGISVDEVWENVLRILKTN